MYNYSDYLEAKQFIIDNRRKQLSEDLDSHYTKCLEIKDDYESKNYVVDFDEDDGALFTVEEFLDCCEYGEFIDYDGYGNPVKDGKLMEMPILPSERKNIPVDATHILWYNR